MAPNRACASNEDAPMSAHMSGPMIDKSIHTNSGVRLVEVGPRDGLQNEATLVPTATKVALIERLLACGHKTV